MEEHTGGFNGTAGAAWKVLEEVRVGGAGERERERRVMCK